MKKSDMSTQNTKKQELSFVDDMFAVNGISKFSDDCVFFNLYVKSVAGNVAIYGCKVVTGKNEEMFISWPNRSYQDKDGAKKYADYANIRFEKGIQDAIIKEVYKHI